MSEELTMESIEKSLDDLVKAADASELLSKAYGGVAIDTYGHRDERGDVSGTLADSGDMGSLDSMMIGKMAETLQGAGYPAGAISAFMAAFQGDDEEEEDGELAAGMGAPASTAGGVGTNPRVRASGGKPTKKSMDHFRSDPELDDALDVAPFLESLTMNVAEQLDGINKSMYAQSANQAQFNRAHAVAAHGLGQLVKSIAGVTNMLAERLGYIEQQPMPQRGHTELTGAAPMNKSMPREQGHAPDAGMTLNKSHVLATLSYMNLEKGIQEIAGRATSELVGTYEAGGQLSQQTFDAVQGFLAAHPHEAETAVTYR